MSRQPSIFFLVVSRRPLISSSPSVRRLMRSPLRMLVLCAALVHRVSSVAIPGFKTTFETVQPGTGGQVVSKGSTVTVHATGIVVETAKKFWSTKDPGQQPFTYKAGVGGVITGWDQGCLGMKVGEVRKLNIPADEGYGQGGFPAWGIPAGGTLDFEIEVLRIEGGKMELR
eukprot:scaffold109899_cov29-Tisochrysis_lutea.AAC.1